MLKDLPEGYHLSHLRGALLHFQGRRTAIDGGAHRGIWSSELRKSFENVIGFEIQKDLAAVARAHHMALGDHIGHCGFAHGTENTGQAHVIDGEEITMTTLDSFNLGDVDFIKLDLEGYELPALRGAEGTIERSSPAIMVEQNGLSARYGYSDEELVEWLGDRGYVICWSWGIDHLYLR